MVAAVAFGAFSFSRMAAPFSCAFAAVAATVNKVTATASPAIRPMVVIFVFIFDLSRLDMSAGTDRAHRPHAPLGALENSYLLWFAAFISFLHSEYATPS